MQQNVARKLLAHALSARQIANMIVADYRAGIRRAILIMGENGIGKTAIASALMKTPEFKGHIFSYIDCTNLSLGDFTMPSIDRDTMTTHYAPNARFGVSKINNRAIEGSRPVFMLFDEMTKAGKAISNMLAPAYYEYRIGDLEFPDRSAVIMTGNLEVENLGDQMEAHKATRLVKVVMRKPTAEEWLTDYALPTNVHPIVRAWVREHPFVLDQSFLNFVADGIDIKDKNRGNPYIYDARDPSCKAYVSPRTLQFASETLYAADEYDAADRDYMVAARLVGTIGEPAMQSIRAFLMLDKELPSIAEIERDPAKCPVPTNRLAHLLLVEKLMSWTNDRKRAVIACTYISRLADEMQALFVRDVTNQPGKALHFVTVKEFVTICQKQQQVI